MSSGQGSYADAVDDANFRTSAGGAAAKSKDGDMVRIGPSRLMFWSMLLFNPLFWLGLFMGVFAHFGPFGVWLYGKLAFSEVSQDTLIAIYEWQKEIPIFGWIGWGLAALILLRAIAVYCTTAYEHNGEFIYIRGGLFDRRNPLGPLSVYSDTKSFTLVYDCDVSKTPLEMLLGVGSLYLKTVDGQAGTISGQGGQAISTSPPMRWVKRPETVRNMIMNKSGVRGSNILGTF